MLPNFIFVGTGKTGTTWLFEQLRRNPSVFVVPTKETNFFDLNYERGMTWYQGFYADAHGGQSAVGEISHRYINNDFVAQRIFDNLGRIKILATLRDPAGFAASDYQFAVRNGRADGTIEDYFDAQFEWDSLEYVNMLGPYCELFGLDNLKIVDFASFQSDPFGALSQVEEFLGVRRTERDEVDSAAINGAADPRSRRIARLVNQLSKFAKRRGHQRLVQAVKGQTILQRMLYTPADSTKVELPMAVQVRLNEIASEQALGLDARYGTSFISSWNVGNRE